jgi:AraC-like DNA-binding protein
MQLLASAASSRLILAHFDQIGLDERQLGLGYIDPALRRSSGPLRVSARLSMDLLEAAAERLGQPDFGLRHALWLNLRGLDSISLLWDHVRSVAQWYDLARNYVHLENNAVGYSLAEEEDNFALVHEILPILRPGARQASFTFLTMTARVFREVLGAAWSPQRVEFMAPRPDEASLFRAFFRCRVEFEAPRDALVVTREDFTRPLARYSPELVAYFESQLRSQSATQTPGLEEQVYGVLLAEMAGGPPSLSQIASRLALTPRTLQRRLSRLGETYGDLLRKARGEVVAAHLRQTPRTSLARLAHELGLSDATAASRFLRQSGVSARGHDGGRRGMSGA